jgi:hypothetical protein
VRLPSEFAGALRAIVGDGFVRTDAAALEAYGTDGMKRAGHPADVVVLPDGAAQISAILTLCSAHRVGNTRERRAQRRVRRRTGHQPDDRLRDDRERAFRSDDQLGEVVADDVLDGLAAGTDHFARRQHRFEAKDVALRRAVFERARTTGAFGDVAANRRASERRGIGRIEQAASLDRLLQDAGDHVRLHDGEQVVFVDLEDAVEPLHRQHDTAAQRHRAAGVARARAARHERHAVLVTERGNRRHFRGRAGNGDDVGWLAALQRVGAVCLPRLVVCLDELRADDRGQRGDEGGRQHKEATPHPSPLPASGAREPPPLPFQGRGLG